MFWKTLLRIQYSCIKETQFRLEQHDKTEHVNMKALNMLMSFNGASSFLNYAATAERRTVLRRLRQEPCELDTIWDTQQFKATLVIHRQTLLKSTKQCKQEYKLKVGYHKIKR